MKKHDRHQRNELGDNSVDNVTGGEKVKEGTREDVSKELNLTRTQLSMEH